MNTGVKREKILFFPLQLKLNVIHSKSVKFICLMLFLQPGGMPKHSTSFSRNAKEGRGDTSAWTDTPSDRAQKAKTK